MSEETKKLVYKLKSIADIYNVLAITTRAEAEKVFELNVGTHASLLVEVKKWRIVPDDGSNYNSGVKIHLCSNDVVIDEEYCYAPVIEGVNVNWSVSSYMMLKAFTLIKIFSSDEPYILSAKKISPLWIETRKSPDKCRPEDLIILIAPKYTNET